MEVVVDKMSKFQASPALRAKVIQEHCDQCGPRSSSRSTRRLPLAELIHVFQFRLISTNLEVEWPDSCCAERPLM